MGNHGNSTDMYIPYIHLFFYLFISLIYFLLFNFFALFRFDLPFVTSRVSPAQSSTRSYELHNSHENGKGLNGNSRFTGSEFIVGLPVVRERLSFRPGTLRFCGKRLSRMFESSSGGKLMLCVRWLDGSKTLVNFMEDARCF